VEVDAVGCGESEVARLVGEPTRRHAVSSGECARERFDCVVASLEAGVSDADAAAESPRGALQQEAAAKRRRCLAYAGAHQAVEVKRAEHRPRRQCPPVKALVERFDHGIDKVAQAIRVCLHAPEYAPPRASTHDRNCCGDLPSQGTFTLLVGIFLTDQTRTDAGNLWVWPGADLLDAGCGTGRYAAELARRGYVVQGIDLSAELVDVARRSIDEGRTPVSFAVGDIQTLPAGRYDAILCRGVLNDIVDDEGRDAVLATFARALRPPGVLILDVREWEASAARKAREPVFKKSVDTDRGKPTFTSVTELDRENRRLVLSERHTLVEDGQERSSDYQFVMRCWTRGELESALTRSGFSPVAYFGAYDPTLDIGATDRLVAVALRSKAAA